MTILNNIDPMDDRSFWSDDLDEDFDQLSADITAFEVDVGHRDTDAVLKVVKQVLSRAKNLETLTLEQLGPDSVDFSRVFASMSSG